MNKKSEYLDDIETLYEREGEIHVNGLNKYDDLISKTTFYRHFDSIDEAIEMADVEYSRKVELICKRCGDVDERPRSFIEKYNGKYKEFCDKCGTVDVQCKNCSDIFEKSYKHSKLYTTHYCCRECYREDVYNDEDTSDYYCGGWGEIRKNVLRSFGWECYCCGVENEEYKQESGSSLDVHHITELKKYKAADIPPNEAHKNASLVPVCTSCHSQITQGKSVLELKIENKS